MSLVGPARVIFGFLFQKHYQEPWKDIGASVITGHDYSTEVEYADDPEAARKKRNAHVRRMYPRIARFWFGPPTYCVYCASTAVAARIFCAKCGKRLL